ncbi:MAG: response regulator transcription factor [Bacteroidota bacterium]
MAKRIHIGIADDHLVLRQGLVSLLKEYENLNVILDVNNGKELMEELKTKKPDIILLDIEMPVMNGGVALEKIQNKYPKVKVIMMSMHFNDGYIIEYIKKGACAFLPKNCDIDKIVEAIFAVHESGYYYDDKVSAAMAATIKRMSFEQDLVPGTDFTKRELEILKLVCKGRSSTEIALELNLSNRTVEGHRYNIAKKINITDQDELIEYAVKTKLIR